MEKEKFTEREMAKRGLEGEILERDEVEKSKQRERENASLVAYKLFDLCINNLPTSDRLSSQPVLGSMETKRNWVA